MKTLTKAEVFYCIGDRFKADTMEPMEYILATVDGQSAALISLFDGNRWRKAEKVNDRQHITEKEFQNIVHDRECKFRLSFPSPLRIN